MADDTRKPTTGPADDRPEHKAVSTALKNLQARFGSESVFRYSEANSTSVPRMSSGSIALDYALGGGLPKGRIIEIFGPEASGKTTIALAAMASEQAQGRTTALIDTEHAYSPEWGEKIGVNCDEMILSQPSSGEEAVEIALGLVRSRGVSLIVLDSVSAMVPAAERDGEMGDSLPGLQARLMGQALRKLASELGEWCTVIFINQIRMKIGTLPHQNPETTTGGKGLPFYASVRIDVRRRDPVKGSGGGIDSAQTVGHTALCTIKKNKVSAPFKQAAVPLNYERGILRERELGAVATGLGIVTISGSWYSYGEQRIGQGLGALEERLESDVALRAEIEAAVRERMALKPVAKTG